MGAVETVSTRKKTRLEWVGTVVDCTCSKFQLDSSSHGDWASSLENGTVQVPT